MLAWPSRPRSDSASGRSLLNDDLSDTEAQLEAQAAAAESASAEAESRIADARASIDDSLSGIAGIVVVSDEDITEAEQAVADAEQSVAEAQAAVDQAQSEVEQARAERDLARAEAEQARAEAAKAELCADACASRPRKRFLQERRHGGGVRGGCSWCKDLLRVPTPRGAPRTGTQPFALLGAGGLLLGVVRKTDDSLVNPRGTHSGTKELRPTWVVRPKPVE